MKIKNSFVPHFVWIVLSVLFCTLLSSCLDEPSAEEVSSKTEKLLANLNVTDAKAIIYKGESTRAANENGYYKIDASGNEVKLQIYNDKGKAQNIKIVWVLKVSDEYIFFRPEPWDICEALGYVDRLDQNDSEWAALDIICMVERNTGKIYKMPYCNMSSSSVAKIQNNHIGISGDESGGGHSISFSSLTH